MYYACIITNHVEKSPRYSFSTRAGCCTTITFIILTVPGGLLDTVMQCEEILLKPLPSIDLRYLFTLRKFGLHDL